MTNGNQIYPDQNFYTAQVPPAMFGPSAPPVFNSGISQLLGPQIASQVDPMIQMGQLFLPLVAPQLQQQGGFMPRFFSTQNYMSQMRAQQFAAQSAVAMQQATNQSQANLFEVMRGGLVQMQGKALTPEQEQSTLQMAQQVAPVMNIASALLPSRLADAIYGNGGNPLRLNQQLLTTGQNMYDPVTGRRGLSGETAGAIGERIYNRLYSNEAMRSQMAGTGTAELSDLLDNLQQRGLLGQRRSMADIVRDLPQVTQTDASIDEIRRRAVAQGATGVTNATVATQYNQMRSLAQAGDPASLNQLKAFAATTTGQEILRAGDADRISRKLKDYNEAVVAIRDIFGDMGQPDAPMAQLMATLDQLTQGGLATKNPAQLAQSVRKTYELARMNNLSMPVVQGLMAQASAQAQAAGLDPELSVNISQNAMAFGASAAVGRIMDNRRFGGFNREKLLLTEMQLQTGAAASPTAQRLGAIVAMYKNDIRLPDELKSIARIAMGEDQGNIDLAQLDPAALTAALQSTGLTTQVISSYLNNKQLAQEQIAEYDIGNLVRTKLQPQGFEQAITRRLTPILKNQTLATAVTKGLIGIGDKVEDPLAVRTALDKVLTDQGIGAGSQAELELMKEYQAPDRATLIKEMGARVIGTLQQDAGLRQQFGNLTTAFGIFNPQTLADMEASEREAAVTGALSGLLAPLGRGNAISNFVEQLKNVGAAGQPQDVSTLLTRSFGIVTEKSLRDAGRDKEANALATVMRLAADTTARAGSADYATNKKTRDTVAQNIRTIGAIMSGGRDELAKQLAEEEARLEELKNNNADRDAIQQQEMTVQSLQYIRDVGKQEGDENFALGAILNRSKFTPEELKAEQREARNIVFNFAEKMGALARPDGSAYTRADLGNMSEVDFEKVKAELRQKYGTTPEFKTMEGELERLSAPQAADGVAAAITTGLKAAKLDINFPSKLNLAGSVQLSFEDKLLKFGPATEAEFDPSMTPPADSQNFAVT